MDAVHSGKAIYLGETKAGNKLYRYDKVVGYNINKRAGFDVDNPQPTSVFMIKGTANPSVVPTSPFAKGKLVK